MNQNNIQYLYIGALILGVFFVNKLFGSIGRGVTSLGEFVGFIDSDKKVNETSDAINLQSYFSNLKNNLKKALKSDLDKAKNTQQKIFVVAKNLGEDKDLVAAAIGNIRNAPSFFNDDEERVYGAIRSLKNQKNLASAIYIFELYNNISLSDYLARFLNNRELSIVFNEAKKLK